MFAFAFIATAASTTFRSAIALVRSMPGTGTWRTVATLSLLIGQSLQLCHDAFDAPSVDAANAKRGYEPSPTHPRISESFV